MANMYNFKAHYMSPTNKRTVEGMEEKEHAPATDACPIHTPVAIETRSLFW